MHIGSFSLSLGPITVVYISEIIEDLSPYMSLIWIETIFIALTSNLMIERFGIAKVFLLYALITSTGLIYVCRFMLETKGKSRQQILHNYCHINEKHVNGINDGVIKGGSESYAL
jgi:hypothetical protein